MNYSEIKLVIDSNAIAWLTLNRPEKHNSINMQMMKELIHAAAELNINHSIRAVVISGEGRSFCAGADLGWMRENLDKNRTQRISESEFLADMLEAINSINKITIARVNGQAYAGGVGLIAVCDIVICVENAKFALTETKLGLTPANISPYLIERIGVGQARRLLLNASVFSADEAVQTGLVHKSVAAADLDSAIETELKSCLSCSPGAIAMTKELIKYISTHTSSENRHYTSQLLADAWETDDAQNGIRSFFKKEPPPWAG